MKIILGSKGADSNGYDFAFSQCKEPDLHLLLNNASGMVPGLQGEGWHTALPPYTLLKCY